MAYGGVETSLFRFDAPVRSRSNPHELISAKKNGGLLEPAGKNYD